MDIKHIIYFIIVILIINLFGCNKQKVSSFEELSKNLMQENKVNSKSIKSFVNSETFKDDDYLYIYDSIDGISKNIYLNLTHKSFSISQSYIDKYYFEICVCENDSIVINYKKTKFDKKITKAFIEKFEQIIPYNLKKELPYLHARITCPAKRINNFNGWDNFEKNVDGIIEAYTQIRNRSAILNFKKDFSSLNFKEKLEIVNSKPISIFLSFNDNCISKPPPPPPPDINTSSNGN